MLSPFLAHGERRRAPAPRRDRPGLGRQRGLAAHRRRRRSSPPSPPTRWSSAASTWRSCSCCSASSCAPCRSSSGLATSVAAPLGRRLRRRQPAAGAALRRRRRQHRARRADERRTAISPAASGACSIRSALLVGVTGLPMFVSHGAAWLALKTEGDFQRSASPCALGALGVRRLRRRDHARDGDDGAPPHDHRSTGGGWVTIVLLVGGIVWSRRSAMTKADLAAFLGSAASIVGLVALAAVGNYPNLVPARGSAAAPVSSHQRRIGDSRW